MINWQIFFTWQMKWNKITWNAATLGFRLTAGLTKQDLTGF
jgi:hypothetical protein